MVSFYFRMASSSPVRGLTCLIHRLLPSLEPEFPPQVPICAMSNPSPAGIKMERMSRCDPSSTTFLQLKLEALLELMFLHTITAPLLQSFASLNTLEKRFC
ncbi:hypothetical protein J1N35_008984 [Gossypium stocksii]|uniref:Uncharacterized protein n=1 Tax=Gossypium stocksii TaxID=47602 RepID=A0A9D4AH77_9ROSI|nr:hypothetical protein J1N35_008984 [Gossypium stocksii]